MIATLIALVTVLTLVPLLGYPAGPSRSAICRRRQTTDRAVQFLRDACGWIAGRMVRQPGIYSLVGLVVVAMFAGHILRNYSRATVSPTGAGSRPGGRRGEPAGFRTDGIESHQCHDPVSARSLALFAETLQVIAEVHDIMQHQPGIGNVWSLETLRRWLAEKAGNRTSPPSSNMSTFFRNIWYGASSPPISMPW